MTTAEDSDSHWWCDFHHTHHHKHQHRFMEILVGTLNPTTGEIEMSDTAATPVTVKPVATEIDVAPGAVSDAEGFPVTSDPLASAVFGLDNPALGTITMNPDNLTAKIETSGNEGTCNVTGTGTTAAGVAVVGKPAAFVVQAGPPATFDIGLTVPPPAPVPGA